MREILPALALISACSGAIGTPNAMGPSVSGSPSPSPSPSTSPSSSPSPNTARALPAGIDRLTVGELATAIGLLLPGQTIDVSGLPPDTRQADFTHNRDQIVDPAFATGLSELAEQAAHVAVTQHAATIAPCARGAVPTAACGATALEALATRAFRRPLSAEDKAGLAAVFMVGATEKDGWYGVELGVQAILQSPSFLYAVAIGGADGMLDDREAAETLARVITGQAADAALISLAAAHQLQDPAVREREARRLFALPAAKDHLAKGILEWLRIDRINDIAKDANLYPSFFGLRPEMWREALATASGAASGDVDTVKALLSAPPPAISAGLTALYGSSTRHGILEQTAFLSVMASPTETSPVRRGNAVLKKLLCVELPLPTGLRVNIVPPAPDPSLTTRERFVVHSRDAACRQCHQQIDPLGFAFEGFDAIGRSRDMENGKPIDSTVHIETPGAVGDFTGADALLAVMAESPETRTCFARNILRFALGTRDPGLEDALIAEWTTRGASGKLSDLLASYAASPWFMKRRAPE
ncbi:MAG: DUF1588 domain-containing protein [Myxococcota bacterium]